MLRFHNPSAWNYPDGLGEAIVHHLQEQGITVIAASADGSTVFVEGQRTGVWMLTDNGGELTLNEVNRDRHVDLPLTSTWGMPSHVQDYALTIVVWILAALHGKSIVYTWRSTLFHDQEKEGK